MSSRTGSKATEKPCLKKPKKKVFKYHIFFQRSYFLATFRQNNVLGVLFPKAHLVIFLVPGTNTYWEAIAVGIPATSSL